MKMTLFGNVNFRSFPGSFLIVVPDWQIFITLENEAFDMKRISVLFAVRKG
jgi:hypothetical protein